jgi:hypothetical protein
LFVIAARGNSTAAEVRRLLPSALLVQQLIISRAIMHACIYKQNIIREGEKTEESDKSAAAQVENKKLRMFSCARLHTRMAMTLCDELNVILSLPQQQQQHIHIYTHYCLFAERALFMYVHALALLQLPPLVTRKVS